MVDRATIAAYDATAKAFADRWDAEPPARDLHDILRRFFTRGPTLEVGCGSGRDAAWLVDQGFPTIAFEASIGLANEARLRHPGLRVEHGALPELEGVAE